MCLNRAPRDSSGDQQLSKREEQGSNFARETVFFLSLPSVRKSREREFANIRETGELSECRTQLAIKIERENRGETG